MKKGLKIAHTPNTKQGMGDFYGTGLTAKVGTVRDGIRSGKLKKFGKPPKSLA